jgi:hypothetical protein
MNAQICPMSGSGRISKCQGVFSTFLKDTFIQPQLVFIQTIFPWFVGVVDAGKYEVEPVLAFFLYSFASRHNYPAA